MFNISVFTGQVMLPELTPEEAAPALQRHGYAGVEWRVVDDPAPQLPPADPTSGAPTSAPCRSARRAPSRPATSLPPTASPSPASAPTSTSAISS